MTGFVDASAISGRVSENNLPLTAPTAWSTGGNSFGTIAVAGQGDVVADASNDTLTLVAGTNITLTTNAGTDAVTIAASGGSGNTLYAPGSVTVATGNFALHVKNLTLTTTQRLTLAGTARFRLGN